MDCLDKEALSFDGASVFLSPAGVLNPGWVLNSAGVFKLFTNSARPFKINHLIFR